MNVTDFLVVKYLTDLRAQPVSADTLVYMVCATDPYDNLGGVFRWDSGSTVAEDSLNYNVVAATGVGTGRWVRVLTRARTLPQGTLLNLGNVKILIASGTTDSSGTCVFNLTLENTASGTAIFSSLMFATSVSELAAASAPDAVVGYKMDVTNVKTRKFGYYKSNAITGTVGALLNGTPVQNVGAGVAVQMLAIGVGQ